MARRFSSKGATAAVAGTAFTHGLGATPDEWKFNYAAAPPAGVTGIYKSAVGTTTITIASSSGAATIDVFACINHSIVK